MADQFLILGHRGSPARVAENTIDSFEEALRGGADGFETDLRLLSDRTAVLYHDDELDEADLESYSYTDFAERKVVVQQLRDLHRFAGRAKMCLEVKRSKWEDALVEHVSGWRDIVVTSFDHSLTAELHRRGVSFPLGITFFGYIIDIASYAERIGATWAYPGFRYVDEAMVTALHERGIKVVPWTVNREREWQRLRELGCDGVITDYPAEAVAWRDR